MKFWAKVMFKSEENATRLIRAFFKDFNPESSIIIRGKEAKAEIVFEKPPMEIVEAIANCNVIELNYGKPLGEYENEQEAKKEECSEKAESVAIRGRKSGKSKSQSEEEGMETITQLAEKSKSYEEFVKAVIDMLELGKRREFFERIVKAAEQIEKVTWNNVEENLNQQGASCSQWEKISCSQQITKVLNVGIMNLIKEIIKYKTYDFNHKETVKMECMPEIANFEEKLGSIYKTLPIEERVKYILTAMGLAELTDEVQENILEIANVAVKIKKMDNIVKVMVKTNIPEAQRLTAQMHFSQFVNGFAEKNGSKERIKLIDFLKDMQKVIMTESEIENLTDSVN